MPFTEHDHKGLIYMTAPGLQAIHGFSTRYGGVSTGHLGALNLGENRGDQEENVRENFRRFCDALGVDSERLVFSKQIHEATPRAVTEADIHTLFQPVPYDADGLTTDDPSISLVIFSADCLPMLLYDPVASAVGACHCGWRGTVGDMAGNTVAQMEERYGSRPENIRAAIGPCISRCCFETNGDVPEAMEALLGADVGPYIDRGKPGKFHVDLKGVNRELLLRKGLLPEHIEVSDECTMCSCEKYWSHRATHGNRGSQCSLITLSGMRKEQK